MTATATEETASTEAIPLGSYQALVAWREHREAVLFAPGSSPATMEEPRSIVGALLSEALAEAQAAYDQVEADTDLALVANNKGVHDRFDIYQGIKREPLPKRDPGASLPAAFTLPRTLPDALANFTPMPGSEKAVEAAIAAHEALAAAPVAEPLPELPPAQEAALERFEAAHDAETASQPAVLDLDEGDE